MTNPAAPRGRRVTCLRRAAGQGTLRAPSVMTAPVQLPDALRLLSESERQIVEGSAAGLD